jgi:hypothetical protein
MVTAQTFCGTLLQVELNSRTGISMPRTLEAEIQRNYATFVQLLGDLLPRDMGRYALLHDCRLAGVFDTPSEAARMGFAKFGHEHYSIQMVTDEPVDLGFMSNAVRSGASPK